ncbi:MAG: hypothetical protein JWQ83_1254 [Lacunisphaera sp.]|nr:hypothetical protein [Lacunisphaera sp.]
MDWIAQHLQLIIALAGGVAWWLNKNREKPAGEAQPPRGEKTFDDPELAERTRRIREEIRRKIEQRVRGYVGEQPTLPRSEPVAPPLVRPVTLARPDTARAVRAAASQQEARRTTEILEQQAALMEQVRLADEMKAAALRRTQFETEVGSKEEAAVAAVRAAVGEDLRNPAALRRAFILREVLGPPLALRP